MWVWLPEKGERLGERFYDMEDEAGFSETVLHEARGDYFTGLHYLKSTIYRLTSFIPQAN